MAAVAVNLTNWLILVNFSNNSHTYLDTPFSYFNLDFYQSILGLIMYDHLNQSEIIIMTI